MSSDAIGKHIARAAPTFDSGGKKYEKDTTGQIAAGHIPVKGGWSNKSVQVSCDYQVELKNPKTGKTEVVTFETVPQDREIGFLNSILSGQAGFDSNADRFSEVLKCEGVQYKQKYSNIGGSLQEISVPDGAPATFDAAKIPALAARIAEFLKSGKTGNSAAFDAKHNPNLTR